MDKVKVKYFVDLGMGVSFLAAFITGIIKFPELLNYLGVSKRSIPFYGINRLHDWSGLVMGILVLIHLMLNWKWIVSITKGFFKKSKV